MSLSIFRRLYQRIITPRYLVGHDLEGNRYLEYPNPHGPSARTKRVVKYRRGFDMWTYVAGERRLPVQWTSWLTHTRAHPPTIEELERDLARQHRVRMDAAMIEAREQEAKNQTLKLKEPQAGDSISLDPTHDSTTPETCSMRDNAGPAGLRPSFANSAPHGPSEGRPQQRTEGVQAVPDEPQRWAPKVLRRTS